MSTSGLFNRMRRMRIMVVFIAMLLAYGTVSYSLQAGAPLKIYSIELGGVTGSANNTALAYGRYALIAPFAPSKGVDENGEIDLTQLDNSFLHMVDTKKPNNPVLKTELTSWDSIAGIPKTVYFPTRVVFDPRSSIAYVRGTRFEENDSEVKSIDVIAYVHLNFDDNGKPLFDTVVPIDIHGVGTEYTNEAPMDFALGAKGDLLVFTNGASVFSYNLEHGYLFELPIVPSSEYSLDNSISFLDVDHDTDVVSVCWNRRSVDKDDVVTVSSEISFFKLLNDGRFEFLKRADRDQFPEGTALARGSDITVVSDPDKDDSEFALFVTTDGSLCAVDLYGDDQDTVRRLYSFPDLAHSGGGDPGRLLIEYDSSRRVVGIVNPGFTIQISRPTNGRRGRISRPTNVASAAPMLAMAKLSKKSKVTSAITFTEEFKYEGGLSNLVSGEESEWLISTYSGNLYSIDRAGDLSDVRLQLIGPIGSRVERIDYYADRASVVAIESFLPGEDGIWVGSPGSLLVGKILDTRTQSAAGAVLQAVLPTASVLGRATPSIRRPCNIKR